MKNKMDKSTRVKHKNRSKSMPEGSNTRPYRSNYDASNGESRKSMARTSADRKNGTVPKNKHY